MPIARFCGEIIFASTPPEPFAAPSRNGDTLIFAAAVVCKVPNSTLEPTSVPVIATPNQPTIGDRNAKNAPAPARNRPRAEVWPEYCMMNASANTSRIVTIAQLNCLSVRP